MATEIAVTRPLVPSRAEIDDPEELAWLADELAKAWPGSAKAHGSNPVSMSRSGECQFTPPIHRAPGPPITSLTELLVTCHTSEKAIALSRTYRNLLVEKNTQYDKLKKECL